VSPSSDLEAELIRRAAGGDARAFADVLEPYRERMWAVCLRITGHRHDAEDALQDALTAAWRNLARFRGDARLSTWLHRIAANAALKQVARRRETPVEEFPDLVVDEPGLASEVVDRDAVARALALLPPDFRAALVLREYGDLSYEEIAEAQGVGVQTVKSRLNRARRALGALLTDA
jgi:RNA polymerase sigma factor (sigma-70 family)